MQAWVVMATHDPDPVLLRRQVASIRAQSISDWTCLVLDDCSADRQAVARVLEQDQRFILLPKAPHLGPYEAFEHLLNQISSPIPVFLCDQDDMWHPRKVERMLSVGGTAFSRMRVTDPQGRVVRASFLPRRPSAESLTPSRLLLMNCVSGAALMLSAETRQLSLPFPAPDLRGWHDQWLAAVAARTGSLSYVDEPLVDYTQHPRQVAGDGLRRITAGRVRMYAQRLRRLGIRSELRSRFSWITAAAQRLLELPGPEDPHLEALARGAIAEELLNGIRDRDVPLPRAALLAAGQLVTPSR